ncbi:hypothetical protein NDU88_004768 [Pleurodeles waltl]|uniref:Uncharacterized protein n=1 Tax=Pleurodeles waltl TaxID=8319 RepID=A0AAV7T9F6_PLEWA|nr:hypothetical protein NDU88_004768 [Pleurodeles waltl]
MEEPHKDVDMKSLLLATKGSLASIETKMDTMSLRIDVMAHKLGSHDGAIYEAEQRLSTVEDDSSTCGQRLTNMDKVLHIIAAKNWDLEVRSQHNNL